MVFWTTDSLILKELAMNWWSALTMDILFFFVIVLTYVALVSIDVHWPFCFPFLKFGQVLLNLNMKGQGAKHFALWYCGSSSM